MSDPFLNRHAEPLFLVPWPVPVFAATFVAIHALVSLVPIYWKGWIYQTFSLVPTKFLVDQADVVALSFANLLTHGFLHYDWLHVGFNVAFLLAAGGPVMRNCGGLRMWALFAICVIAGGVLHVAVYWNEPATVIGASGGVGGLLAAALRYRTRKLSQGEIVAPVTRGPVAAFAAFWLGLNLAFFLWEKIGGSPLGGIATMAHIGGFLAGLFLAPVMVRGARAQSWPRRT